VRIRADEKVTCADKDGKRESRTSARERGTQETTVRGSELAAESERGMGASEGRAELRRRGEVEARAGRGGARVGRQQGREWGPRVSGRSSI